MESIEFINRYESYLDEISEVVKPELLPIIEELRKIDLHDLVRPDWISEIQPLKNISSVIFSFLQMIMPTVVEFDPI